VNSNQVAGPKVAPSIWGWATIRHPARMSAVPRGVVAALCCRDDRFRVVAAGGRVGLGDEAGRFDRFREARPLPGDGFDDGEGAIGCEEVA